MFFGDYGSKYSRNLSVSKKKHRQKSPYSREVLSIYLSILSTSRIIIITVLAKSLPAATGARSLLYSPSLLGVDPPM